MEAKKLYGGLDWFKLVAAFLVVAIHTSPLESFSAEWDFLLTRVVARVAVPFFLMVTGFFILPKVLFGEKEGFRSVWKFVKKTSLLYLLATVIYIPVGIYAGHFQNISFFGVLRMIVFDGTFYHLWYLPASVLGVLLLVLLSRKLPFGAVLLISSLLYLVGLFGDSYFGLVSDLPVLSNIYEAGFQVFSYTRNGLFFTPVFLALGAWFGRCRFRLKKPVSFTGLIACLLLMAGEGFLLRQGNVPRHDSMYLLLAPTMFFLFSAVLSWKLAPAPRVRSFSTWVYIFHPLMIVLVRGAAKALNATDFLVENSLVHFLAVCFCSLFLSAVVVALSQRRARPPSKARAWVELDREALRHNVRALQAQLPGNCELMPVVKADAYGHGAVPVSKELNRMGIRAFCVASVCEGVILRKNLVRGEILILGYTHPSEFSLLRRYRLSQTVIDFDYAEKLNRFGKKVRVHVGIDTGMHRLGERCENVSSLVRIFRMKNLQIKGVFTHLCADQSTAAAEKQFTEAQALAFQNVISILQRQGFPCPKTHLLASYGAVNYPELAGDYARVGLALYGVLGSKEETAACSVSLKPVLSLKARVASVKNLYSGETAGYGLTFFAPGDMKIAAVSIGYADGFPRALSNGAGKVLIRGREAPVIGSVCMDQVLVDVTQVPEAAAGDIATIIGTDGGAAIGVCDLAEQAGTITNEIFSRLGNRLERNIVL